MSNEEDAEELYEIAREFHGVLNKLRKFSAKTCDGKLWERVAMIQDVAVDLYGHQAGYKAHYADSPDQWSLAYDLEEQILNIIDGKPDSRTVRVGNKWILLVPFRPDEKGFYTLEASGCLSEVLCDRYLPAKPEAAPRV